ncbi:MAG: DNA repair protein RecO [Pseudohongiellaceae bacterium]
MSREVQLQPAYLLHSRPFRDTSVLLDFITRDYGRLSAIARGARGIKSRTRGLLQPFIPLQITYAGRNELKSLRSVELLAQGASLKGNQLFSALYMNELATRLIHGHESDHALYDTYEQSLQALSAAKHDVEPVLRSFELSLLEVLGYGVSLDHEAETGQAVEPDGEYHFQHETGLVRLQGRQHDSRFPSYPGSEIIRISQRDFSADSTRKLAKKLLRQILSLYLGDRPLKSRQLFNRR